MTWKFGLHTWYFAMLKNKKITKKKNFKLYSESQQHIIWSVSHLWTDLRPVRVRGSGAADAPRRRVSSWKVTRWREEFRSLGGERSEVTFKPDFTILVRASIDEDKSSNWLQKRSSWRLTSEWWREIWDPWLRITLRNSALHLYWALLACFNSFLMQLIIFFWALWDGK